MLLQFYKTASLAVPKRTTLLMNLKHNFIKLTKHNLKTCGHNNSISSSNATEVLKTQTYNECISHNRSKTDSNL